MIRVVVVDDSPTMRALITAALSSDPEITVVGEAGDAFEARAIIKFLNPDVITLDINMPQMSGLEFLNRLLTLRPMPVLVLSGVDDFSVLSEVDRLGVEFFQKRQTGANMFSGLSERLKEVVRKGVKHNIASQAEYRPSDRFLTIGASTGGVEALLKIFKEFPRNCPPTVVTQHMPPGYTSTFAERLNRLCAPNVLEARSGLPLKEGRIYIAPGGPCHLEVVGKVNPICRLSEGALESGHRPSVDVLFRSAASFGARAVGVILTGMGQDGALGLLKMREAGAYTIGQDQRSSLVYGMPGVAAKMGAVEVALPLRKIAQAALEVCRRKHR